MIAIKHRNINTCVANVLLFSIILLSTLFILSNIFYVEAFAADRLTDVFQTKSFRGSSEALSKMSWLGMIMHYVISWFSFLGLCLTLYQKFITLLYLSAKNLFDNINDVKMNRMKGGPAGIKGLLDILKTGEGSVGGGGIDVFITFVYGLLPNIKAYSDYADGAKANQKLEDTDTPTQYMLKTALPTIMLIFFLTIGYSGTLGKAYGMIVDGLATAADTLVTKNLAAYVKKLVTEGEAYQFTISAHGSASARIVEDVARTVYQTILMNTDGSTMEFNQRVGYEVEQLTRAVFGIGSDYITTWNGQSSSRDVDRYGWTIITEVCRANYGSIWPKAFDDHGNETADDLILDDNKAHGVSMKSYVNMNPGDTAYGGVLDFNLREIVSNAMAGSNGFEFTGQIDQYVHIMFQYNPKTNANWLAPITGRTQSGVGQNSSIIGEGGP